MNREEWLTKLLDSLRPDYTEKNAPLPEKLRVTCGWPSKGALKTKQRVIGECFPPQASKDGRVEIFISPCLEDSGEVAAVLVHELVHATGAIGHRGSFRKLAESLGLEGPMTATHAGKDLLSRLNAITEPLGAYPHAKVDRTLSPHKKDGTRLLKVVCPVCDYTVRVTRKWLDIGLPTCPDGDKMEEQPKEDPA